jgi:branched-chain amino acid aminotransferase
MINYNGTLFQAQDFQLPYPNRAFSYADGVMESLRVVNGKIWFWEDHYFRLMGDMRVLRLEIPTAFTPEFLEEEILRAVEKNRSARVRMYVYRKAGGLYTPISKEVEYIIESEPWVAEAYKLNEIGLHIQLFQEHQKPTGLLSNLKSTNAQVYIVAGIFAKENNYGDVILLNEHKRMVEGVSSNLFLVQDGKVYTPALAEGPVKGVFRKNLIDVLKKNGVEVIETELVPFELQRADEVWLTNAVGGIKWVGQFRKKTYGRHLAEKAVDWMNERISLI